MSSPWMISLPYVPYYSGGYDKRWEQPPMVTYAFHPGWAAPRSFVHDRLAYPKQGRLNNGANRPVQGYMERPNRKVWRAKSTSAESSEHTMQEEESTSAKTVMV